MLPPHWALLQPAEGSPPPGAGDAGDAGGAAGGGLGTQAEEEEAFDEEVLPASTLFYGVRGGLRSSRSLSH